MKAFITRYALTKGIYEEDVEECGKGLVKTKGTYSKYFHGEGVDWHRTIEGAIDRAEEMRMLKLRSLEQSMDRLKALDFTKIKGKP
jgi:hypothetical protein